MLEGVAEHDPDAFNPLDSYRSVMKVPCPDTCKMVELPGASHTRCRLASGLHLRLSVLWCQSHDQDRTLSPGRSGPIFAGGAPGPLTSDTLGSSASLQPRTTTSSMDGRGRRRPPCTPGVRSTGTAPPEGGARSWGVVIHRGAGEACDEEVHVVRRWCVLVAGQWARRRGGPRCRSGPLTPP